MITSEALTAELEILTRQYQLAAKRATQTVESYADRKPTDHFGHNLASVAAELSALAGKWDAVNRVRLFVLEQEKQPS